MYLASKSPQRKALLDALGLDFDIVPPVYDEVDEVGMLPAQLVERHSRGKALSVLSRIAPVQPERPVLGVDTMVAVHGRAVGKAHDEAAARDYLEYMSGKVHLVYSGITLVSAAQPGDRDRDRAADDRQQQSVGRSVSARNPGESEYPPEPSLVSHADQSQASLPENEAGGPQRGIYPEQGEAIETEGDFDDPVLQAVALGGYDYDSDDTDSQYDDLVLGNTNVEEIEAGGQKLELRTASAATEVHFAPLTDADIDAYIATGEWRERAGAYAIQGRASAFVEEVHGDYNNIVGLPVALLVEMLREIGLWPPAEWTVR